MVNTYQLEVPEVGTVKVSKKRGQSSLRIRLSAKGEVLVSAPWSLPRIAIEKYVKSKTDWILENIPEYGLEFRDGMKFGDKLELKIHENNNTKNRSKIATNTLNIYLASKLDISDKKQQDYIEKRVLNSMKHEAEAILLPRLNDIAKATDHSFNQAYVKNLKSRWGSCDRQKNIILNIFMLQLPEELQHYVILHELTHTQHLNHSKEFWTHLASFLPEARRLSKELKVHQPRIEPRI